MDVLVLSQLVKFIAALPLTYSETAFPKDSYFHLSDSECSGFCLRGGSVRYFCLKN